MPPAASLGVRCDGLYLVGSLHTAWKVGVEDKGNCQRYSPGFCFSAFPAKHRSPRYGLCGKQPVPGVPGLLVLVGSWPMLTTLSRNHILPVSCGNNKFSSLA